MASRDSAFLWETEVLRSARRASSDARSERSLLDRDDWVTLRQASALTGISTTTLKKLARSKDIPSHLEKSDDGFLRIVSLDGIRRWEDAASGPDDDEMATTSSDDVSAVDLIAEEDAGTEPAVPEGTMLVPLDAWNKMLNQLGNLHEAGQQLAEARERAAKAETEAQFLRERLRELREQVSSHAAEQAPPHETAVPSNTPSARLLIRKIYSDWRKNRRR